VLPRIWIALLALLLLGACAGATSAERMEGPSPSGLACSLADDDDASAHVPAPAVEAPARPIPATRPDSTAPPSPELARIFRPPQPPRA
jgi:hypothetical protein